MNDHRISSEIMAQVKRKIFDVPYCEDSPSQKLDIWYPNEAENTDSGIPAILFFHGGGFCVGGKQEDCLEPILKSLDHGYAVIDVEYRKSGEARFPAMLFDAKAAIRFVKAHAKEYQLDAGRIALWGASCGGWIVSMAAVTANLPAFEDRKMGNAECDATVQAVVDWCGPCGDFLNMDKAFLASGKGVPDHDQADSGESRFLGAPLPEVRDLVHLASPANYVHDNVPYFCIIHGEDDQVVPIEQSYAFVSALQTAGQGDKVEFHPMPGVKHHGKIWWHEETAPSISLDFLDRILK